MVWAFAELIVTHSHAVLNQQKSFYCTCLHRSTANLIEDEKSDISFFKSFGNFNLHSLFFPIYSKSTSLYLLWQMKKSTKTISDMNLLHCNKKVP